MKTKQKQGQSQFVSCLEFNKFGSSSQLTKNKTNKSYSEKIISTSICLEKNLPENATL